MSGRKPDYRLKAFHKITKIPATIGAGWSNSDGSISVQFNLCTIVEGGNENIVYNLFPEERKKQDKENSSTQDSHKPPF